MPHPIGYTARRRLMLLLGAAAVVACPSAPGADLSGVASRAAVAARRPAPPRVTFDPAVVPAGGTGCCGLDGRCGTVQQAGFHHGHAAGCRNGMCMPSCPVRPGQYGYYGTQWRRWPGQGVVQASAVEAATPVAPPKSAVPNAEEESPAARGGAEAIAPAAQLEDGVWRAGDEPARPLPPQDDANALPPPEQPLPRQRDSAAVNSSGPWSRMVAASSLPPGYEPPQPE
jgi:hypothetical protein